MQTKKFYIDNFNDEPFKSLILIDQRNKELVQKPEIVEKEKCGSCYDQTFLVKKWFDEINIETKIFYSITNNVSKKK